eukprot:3015303-Prorocentrum_lima.AAC.1
MTSSLVGSEMCIRDRSKGRCVEHCAKHLWIRCLLLDSLGPSMEDPLMICLLYTSDAADDM